MILNKSSADKKLRRMAMEIAERNIETTHLILIGIKANGLIIAEKIAHHLKTIYPGTLSVLALEINKRNPDSVKIEPEMDFNGKTIIVIDDVANSGRTFLYALKPLLQCLPKQIETLALVERTYKLFPIDINYVGISVSTQEHENIAVLVEGNEITGAAIKEY